MRGLLQGDEALRAARRQQGNSRAAEYKQPWAGGADPARQRAGVQRCRRHVRGCAFRAGRTATVAFFADPKNPRGVEPAQQ